MPMSATIRSTTWTRSVSLIFEMRTKQRCASLEWYPVWAAWRTSRRPKSSLNPKDILGALSLVDTRAVAYSVGEVERIVALAIANRPGA